MSTDAPSSAFLTSVFPFVSRLVHPGWKIPLILNYLINILTPLQLVLLATSHTYSTLLFRNYNFN